MNEIVDTPTPEPDITPSGKEDLNKNSENLKEKEEEEEDMDLETILNFIDELNDFQNNQKLLYESFQLNNHSQINEGEKNPKFLSQKHEHGLVFLLSNINWSCNLCGISKTENDPKNYCSLCDYNICNNCIGNEKKYPLALCCHEQTKLKSFKFPFHEHSLIYCRTSRQKDKLTDWTCDLCNRIYSNKIWSFFCTFCDYDACLNCSKKYFSSDELVTNHGIKIDDHEHLLVYMITNRNWNCKLCSKSKESIEPTFYCTKCEYNTCMNCMSRLSDEQKYPFFNDGERLDDGISTVDINLHKHPLIYCITSRARIATYWYCNSCSGKYGYEDWSFYCSICDYDICFQCYLNYIEKN